MSTGYAILIYDAYIVGSVCDISDNDNTNNENSTNNNCNNNNNNKYV